MAKLREELDKVASELRPPNIAVIGRTGAGKSTLINSVFGEHMADVSSGLPVSKVFERFPKDPSRDSKVVLYDSMGYEQGKDNEFLDGIKSFIGIKRNEGVDNEIHLVWYVVPGNTKRFLHFDADVVKTIQDLGVPICIVLSQVDTLRATELDGMEKAIDCFIGDGRAGSVKRVSVAALPQREEDEPFGIIELVDITIEMLPTLYTEAFIVRQTSNLKAKRKLAFEKIRYHAGGCFATGFVPIPFTTPAAAITSQTVLVKQIAEVYEYTDLATILSDAAKVTKASIVFYISSSILDFISSATIQFGGFLASGSLAGTAAATYIVAVGFTYITIFEKVAKDDIDGLSRDQIEKKLRSEFQQELKRLSSEVKINKKSDLQNLDTLLRNASSL